MSQKRVAELNNQLTNKKENLENFTRSSQEHKQLRAKEIENLKKTQNEMQI